MTTKEQAQAGLKMLKESVETFVRLNPDGVTNADVVSALGLESDFEGSQRNYLSWSILGLLVGEKRVRYVTQSRSKVYFSNR